MARASASNKAAAAKQNAKIELPQVSPGSKANSAQWWTFAPANWWTFAPALTPNVSLKALAERLRVKESDSELDA
jgi:hypothetical protein